MKHGFIRFLDLWIGRFVCALLTGVRYLQDFVGAALGKATSGVRQPKKILFIKWIEQGATVLAYGAITRAIELVGRENVYFSVFVENKEILDFLDILPRENIIALRNRSFRLFLFDVLASLVQVRRLGIDATVDFEFFARASAIYAFLSGAKSRVGLHRFTSEAPYRGDLMTHRVQHNPYLHITQSYRLLVEALTLDPREVPMVKLIPPSEASGENRQVAKFKPSLNEVKRAHEFLSQLSSGRLAKGRMAGPLVLLNPNASDLLPLRKWPTERFVELGRQLLATEPDITLVITGAPGERDDAEKVALQIGTERVLSIAGKTTLRELIVIYSVSQVLVTNDSGPAHFASLTPISAVTLFGPETPHLFGARAGDPHVLWAGLACSPCVNQFNHRNSPCTNNICMQAIEVDQVADKVRALLARSRSSVGRSQLAG